MQGVQRVCINGLWSSLKCGRCMCARRKRRPPSSRSAPLVRTRSDDSDTESEPEPRLCCQAVRVACLSAGADQPRPLAERPCLDQSAAEAVTLLASDAEVPDVGGLPMRNGSYQVGLCSSHRTWYVGNQYPHKCSRAACYHRGAFLKGGCCN